MARALSVFPTAATVIDEEVSDPFRTAADHAQQRALPLLLSLQSAARRRLGHMRRSRVFVGSSTESIDVARAVQSNLDEYAEVTVWTQGIFGIGRYILDELVRAATAADFAIFVFGPDDQASIRGQEVAVARDNVVFELGLFTGLVGQERSYFLMPHGLDVLHIPSDLVGVNCGTFDPDRMDKNLRAALGRACSEIGQQIREKGPRAGLPQADVNGSRIELVVGSLPEDHTADWLCVYPANVYFDTTFEGGIVDPVASTLGRFLTECGGNGVVELDEALTLELASVGDLPEDPAQPYIQGKPGRQRTFPPGTAARVSHGDRSLLLLASGRINDRLRAVADLACLNAAYTGLWSAIADRGDAAQVMLPVIGAGKGRIDPVVALSTLLATFRSQALAQHRFCDSVRVVIYEPTSDAVPRYAADLFEAIIES